jgi:phosphohistidine phosphatase
MKQLLMMRHSEAMPSDCDTDDFDRRLTSNGKLLIDTQAELIIAMEIKIDRIYTSNSRRTMETSQRLAEKISGNVTIKEEPFLYHNYLIQTFINFIHEFDKNDQIVAIVGHNPGITQVTQKLINSYTAPFRPATFALINFDVEKWKEVEVGSGRLMAFQTA